MTVDESLNQSDPDGADVEVFLSELRDSGYSDRVAEAALRAVGPSDIDTGNAFTCVLVFYMRVRPDLG